MNVYRSAISPTHLSQWMDSPLDNTHLSPGYSKGCSILDLDNSNTVVSEQSLMFSWEREAPTCLSPDTEASYASAVSVSAKVFILSLAVRRTSNGISIPLCGLAKQSQPGRHCHFPFLSFMAFPHS